jgi:hypothetical protein
MMGQNHSQMLTFEPVVANSVRQTAPRDRAKSAPLSTRRSAQIALSRPGAPPPVHATRQAPLQPRALATPAATHTWCALPEPGGDAAGAASALAGADELAAANALAAARAFAAAGASMEAKRAAATAQDDGGREPFGLGPELWDDAPTPELRRIAALASRLCGARAAAIALAGLGGRARVCLCADGAGRAAWPPRGGWEQLAADAWALASGPAAAAPTFFLDAAKDSRCARRARDGAAAGRARSFVGSAQSSLIALKLHYNLSPALPPPARMPLTYTQVVLPAFSPEWPHKVLRMRPLL